MLKIKEENSQKIQTLITFYSDVRLCPVIYQDARNEKRNLPANSNDNKFLRECPLESHFISRRSKLKMEDSRKFKQQ